MIHTIKVFKPNKKGKLVEVERISDTKASEMHWSAFNKDFNGAPSVDKTTMKYHRLGVPLKKCIEEGCTTIVEDPGCLTCSLKCKLKREDRQRKLVRVKENNFVIVCKNCKLEFRSRKDRKYCSKTCRYSNKKGIHFHGKSNN